MQYDSSLISLTYEPEGPVKTGTGITEIRKALEQDLALTKRLLVSGVLQEQG
jgi:hypothetical protein